MFSTSPTLRDCQRTVKVSSLKRCPPQASHGTLTSGKKLISRVSIPCPPHSLQRPSPVLKEKREAFQPRMRASRVSANKRRTSSQKPTYVAGHERGVLPIGVWSTSNTRSSASHPLMVTQPDQGPSLRVLRLRCRLSSK